MSKDIKKHKFQSILIVDDELEITKALVRQFKRNYTVFSATNAADALRIMETNEVQVIISDQRMPDITGVEFFTSLKTTFPDVIKLILTGYTDIEAAIAAINHGQVFRYITKPWNPEELNSIIHEAFEKYELVASKKELIQNLTDAKINLEDKVKNRTKELEQQKIKLERSEHRLKTAQKMALIGNWELNLITNELHWSDEIYKIFEIDKAVFGATYDAFLEAIHPDDREIVNAAYALSLEDKLPYQITHRLLMPDGRIKYVKECCDTNYSAEGKPSISVGTVQDITEIKLKEIALLEREFQYRSLVENSPDAITIYTDFKVVFVNKSCLKLMGAVTEAELIGKPVIEFVHPESRLFVAQRMSQVNTVGILPLAEEKFVRLDGTPCDVDVKAMSVTFEGKPAVQLVVRDISERKLSEKKLNESEEKFRSIFENSSVGKSLTTLDGKLKVNKAFSEILGYPEEELNSFSWKKITYHDDIEANELILNSIIAGKKDSASWQKRYVHKDGQIVWTEITTTLQKDTEGKPLYFISELINISDQKQAEIALRESEEKYRILFEANKDGIALFKPYPDGTVSNFLEMNESAGAMLGYTKAEFSTMNPSDIEVDITEEKMNLRLNDLKTKGFSTFETNLRHKNGSIVPVEIIVQVIKYNNLPALMNITRDISEHKKAENIIQQSREQFKDLYENAPIGYHEIDTEGKIMRMNKTELEMFGYMMEDVNGHYIWEFFHNKTISEAITKRKLGGIEISVLPYEREFKHKNGSLVTILVQDKVLRDTNGKITGIRSTVQDITQRKQTEQKLQESELFFRETQHVGGIGSYKLNFQTGYWNSSEVLDNIFGIDAEFERSVSGWVDIIFQEDKDMMNRYFAEEVVGKHHIFNKEYRIQRISDGEVRWVHGLGKLVFDENKQLLLMQGTIQDITERNTKENLLLESERRFRELLSSVQLASVILDMDGNITFCNEYLLNLTQYKHNEVIDKNWFEIFIPGNDVEEIKNIFKKSIFEGGLELYHENEILTIENKKRLIAWSNTLLYDSKGKINGVASLGIDITEQRKAAESIRKSKDRLNRAEFASKSGNWEFYAENGIIKASKGAAKVYGLKDEEFNYENIKSILLPEYLEMMDVALKNLIEKNEPYNIEFKIKSVDTNEIKDIHSSAVYDNDRKVVFGVIQDITDKKRAEQALAESENEFRSLIELSPVPIAIIHNSKVVYFNTSATDLFGATSNKDVLNKSMFDFIHPDYHDLARQNVLLIAENGYIPTHEEKYSKFDGNIIDVESQAKSIRFNGENATIVMINDITARKRAEKELRESEERYRNLLLHLETGVVVHAPDTSIVMSNPRASVLLGLTNDQMMGKVAIDSSWKFVNADGATQSLEDYPVNRIINTKQPLSNIIIGIAKSQKPTITWVMVNGFPVLNSAGEIIEIVISFDNITEQKNAEIELKNSEEKFKKAFMTNPESVTITSIETGIYKEVNKGFCQILGYDVSDVIGRKSTDLNIWYDISDRQFIVNELKAKSVVENHVSRFITKKGETIYGMVSATIIDLNGEKHILLITRDITKIKKAEQKLQETNDRLNLILESSPIAIWDWDIVNDKWFATPKYFTMLGYKPESGLPDRKIWLNRVHPDDRLMVNDKISNVLNHSSNNYKYDARMLHADGSYRWQTVIGQVIENDTENNAVRMIGVRIDVHERMKAEETLKRSQKLLSETEKIGKVGGWEFNMDTLEQSWTEETYNIHELPYDYDTTVENGINFYTPESLPVIQNAVKLAIEKGEPFDLELEIITAKGNLKCVHTIGKVDSIGRRIIGFFQDITERKKAEEQINMQMQELRRWYDVTLDREGRVLELKREVNELLKMHGEALRYGNNIEESIDINKKE